MQAQGKQKRSDALTPRMIQCSHKTIQQYKLLESKKTLILPNITKAHNTCFKFKFMHESTHMLALIFQSTLFSAH